MRARSSVAVRWATGVIGAGLVGAGGVVMASQAARRSGSAAIASLQALTPHVAIAMAPVTVAALRARRPAVAAAAGVVGIGGLLVAAPAVRPRQPRVGSGAGLRIATVNLLYTNDVVGRVGDDLLERDHDVIVFTEYTDEHHEALSSHPLCGRFPHRIDRPGPRAKGLAVWSGRPLREHSRVTTINNSIDVTVEGSDGTFRLLGVHTPTPVLDFREWVDDLDTIRRALADGDQPTVVIGDFNATYWHPAYRAILTAGFADAHIGLRRWFASSWPVGGVVPAFAQLDRAVTGRGLVATAVANFPVPGSDHRGLVVTVARAR